MDDEGATTSAARPIASLISTVEELQVHGLHSATIVEALIALAVQFAVRDWGRAEAKAILK
jgi:hypothetical protein